jgi:hypothetical protein
MTGPLRGVRVVMMGGLGFDNGAVAELADAGVVRQSAAGRSN